MDPSFERRGGDLVNGEAVSMLIEHLTGNFSILVMCNYLKADSSINSMRLGDEGHRRGILV